MPGTQLEHARTDPQERYGGASRGVRLSRRGLLAALALLTTPAASIMLSGGTGCTTCTRHLLPVTGQLKKPDGLLQLRGGMDQNIGGLGLDALEDSLCLVWGGFVGVASLGMLTQLEHARTAPQERCGGASRGVRLRFACHGLLQLRGGMDQDIGDLGLDALEDSDVLLEGDDEDHALEGEEDEHAAAACGLMDLTGDGG